MNRLLIDDRVCLAEDGRTLLEAANAHGIAIPTLCHDPRVTPEASCRVCLVEVREGSGWRLRESCATPAADGMVVRTRSTAVDEARRWALELLLSDHDADCVAPCQLACPAGVDVQGYVAAVADARFLDATAIVRRTNPLPSVCGRICPHPCEAVCRRGLMEGPVAVNLLKRLATSVPLPPPPAPGASTGRHVAIVGAGPAGLSAAWFLRLQGHGVTVLDAEAEPGGMLRYGVPEFRLPSAALAADVEAIASLGVDFEMGQRLGQELTLADLSARFDAVFLALGATKERHLGLEGEDAAGVHGGLAFLRSARRAVAGALSGDVAVVGGGNTALDAARTALRLGAARVVVLYRRTRTEMPAYASEIDAAEAEGVSVETLVAPIALRVEAGRLRGVRLQRMALGDEDESGRRRPVPVPGEELDVPFDHLVVAVGEASDTSFGAHVVDVDTLATSRHGVFAGGDFVTGPRTAVEAIAAGRRAAVAIDEYLRTGHAWHPPAPVLSRRTGLDDVSRGVAAALRAEPTERSMQGFRETALGLSAPDGCREATRCLACGCAAFERCELRHLMDAARIEPSRLRGAARRYAVEPLRSGLVLDMNKCIRCTRCVRVCRELVQVGALELIHRGYDTRLLFAVSGDALARCDACLATGAPCVAACPTGALVEGLT